MVLRMLGWADGRRQWRDCEMEFGWQGLTMYQTATGLAQYLYHAATRSEDAMRRWGERVRLLVKLQVCG